MHEEARWRILATLYMGMSGPPLSENLLLDVLSDAELPVTLDELRRDLVYLEDRKLIHIKDRKAPTWHASLGHHGVDIVEYSVECLPGIGRPPRR